METHLVIDQHTERGLSSPFNADWNRSRDGFIIFDQKEHVVHASGSLREVLRLPAEVPLTGEAFRDLLTIPLGSDEEILSTLGRWLDQSDLQLASAAGEPSVLLTTTESRMLHGSLSLIGERFRVATFRDVTTTLEAESKMLEIAYRDQLTGIGNRSFFESRLEAAMVRLAAGELETVTVLFIDLDRFKVINDTLGHAIGDQLLRLVAERLQSSLCGRDVLARMGGDEFAILLGDCPGKTFVTALATRIIDLIQRTYLIDGQIMNVGASIGIAVSPTDACSSEQLLRSSDLALYHSKSMGRGVLHFFQPAMEEKAQRRRALDLDLRRALVLRQFELHYSPQIDVESQAIIGLEGLLRWRHPQHGLMLPREFLPLAEEIGLAVQIGEWVLKTACREATRWPDSVTVAVNVSSIHFEMTTFADSVEHALTAASLSARRLEIEVTEDVFQRNGPIVLATLTALRTLGIRVVMDNFGVGLASLSQLVNFPFDKIKIDRSLLNIEGDDIKNRAIVRAISALGESLGISTLAAGVETSEHLSQVRSGGCSYVQGFYYGDACPASELTSLFSNLNLLSAISK